PGRSPRRGRIRLCLQIALCQARVDVAGTDAIYADALLAVIDGHRFGQPDDGGLGGAVARAHRLNEKAVHRRHIDDAPFRLLEVRHKELGAEKDAAQVHRDFAVPFLDRGVLDRLVHLNRRVVEERVDLGKSLQGLGYQPLDRSRVGDVRFDGQSPSAAGFDLSYGFGGAGEVDI